MRDGAMSDWIQNPDLNRLVQELNEASLAQWVRQGKVDREEALLRANHPEELKSLLVAP